MTTLTTSFIEEEIKDVVWMCDDNKSLGLDKFKCYFIKGCWDIEKEVVISFVQEFSAGAKLLKVIFTQFLALIPKKDHSQSLNEYKQICLIGGLYKIIDKCQNIIFDHI